MGYKQEADKLQDQLNELHFVITEPDRPENREKSRALFNTVFDRLIRALDLLLMQDGETGQDSMDDILALSYARKRFNRQTFTELKQMAVNRTQNNVNETYKRLLENDARLLQMLADMLRRFGEEQDDDE